LYLHELAARGYGAAAPNRHDMLEARAEFNFRLVEVMMMLLLPLLAVALAVPPKRSASSLGIFVSIVTVVAYHNVNQYAGQRATQGRVDSIVALWVPFLLLGAMIVWMYHVLAHKPGGQPIGALEFAASKSWRRIRNLFPRMREV